MKATIEIDATPQEMRELLGLPEVQSIQKEMMDKIRDKMLAGVDSGDAASLMKLFMPMPEQMKGFEDMQSSIWKAMSQGVSVNTNPEGDKKKD